jgi:hypothetical protein
MSKNEKPKAKKLRFDPKRVRTLQSDELKDVQGGAIALLSQPPCRCCSVKLCCVSD